MPEYIYLKDIIVDHEIQPRVNLDREALEQWLDVIAEEGDIPPVDVFVTPEGEKYLSEGFHRYEAHQKAGKRKILVNLHEGTRRDAILYGIEANLRHGVRYNNADKRQIAARLLKDPEWGQWSANAIAKRIGVSQPFISGLREELIAAGELEAESVKKVSRGDSTYEINTTRLKNRKKAEPKQEDKLNASGDSDQPLQTELRIVPDQPVQPPVIASQPKISPDKQLTFSSVKYGDVFDINGHRLYFGAFAKTTKKLTEFDYCLWFDSMIKLKENSEWLFNHVGVTTIVTQRGAEIRSFDTLGIPWQSGTLVQVGIEPCFLGHFSGDNVELGEFNVSDYETLAFATAKELTTDGNTVLIVSPPSDVLPLLHSLGRIVTIVSTDATYAQFELMHWEEQFGETMPIKKH